MLWQFNWKVILIPTGAYRSTENRDTAPGYQYYFAHTFVVSEMPPRNVCERCPPVLKCALVVENGFVEINPSKSRRVSRSREQYRLIAESP